MNKRTWIWIAVAAGVVCLAVVSCCCFTGMLGGLRAGEPQVRDEEATAPREAVTPAEAAEPAGAPPTAMLPPDPPPPVAHRASEVPELERELAAMETYQGIWSAERRDDLRLLLTAAAELLSAGGLTEEVGAALTRRRLREVATQLYMIVARVGRYPDDFTRELTTYLASIRDEPRHGVWSPGTRTVHDFAALAAWVHREDVTYLREFLASRREGPHQWTRYATARDLPMPWIEWLALPGVAYERLSSTAVPTDDEWSAWCESIGQERVERIDPDTGETRRACGCSEGSPVGFEDMRERWPLTVPGGCLQCEALPAGRIVVQRVSFSHEGRRYRVNGAAAADPRNAPIDPIWADDPEHEGLKITIGDLIQRGLGLCR